MKFILQPSVYVVIKPTVDKGELNRFLEENGFTGKTVDSLDIPTGELPVVIGSRTCYQSFDNGRKHDDHVKHLIDVGHGSTLEHSNYGILITGVSRSLTHELIRHRQFGVSQLSQRFVEHDDCNFVVPPALIPHWDAEAKEISSIQAEFIDMAEYAVNAYEYWMQIYQKLGLKNKEAKEAARAVLPNCTETRILITGDLRCWRVFFELRCDEGADKEIRRLAWMCYKRLRGECPNVFGDYVSDETSQTLDTENRKV